MKIVKLENVVYSAPYNRSQLTVNKNCGINLKADDEVIVKDVTLTDAACAGTRYNAIEIGLNNETKAYRPRRITVDNVRIEGTITNNGILIFDCADNAVITIKNCYFKQVSNAIRFSNYSMSKNVTINIEDCVCDGWEDPAGSAGIWAGFLLLEDYRADHTKGEDFGKCFGKETGLKINIKNLTMPDGTVYAGGTDTFGLQPDHYDRQVIIGCLDNRADPSDYLRSYNEDEWPVINVTA